MKQFSPGGRKFRKSAKKVINKPVRWRSEFRRVFGESDEEVVGREREEGAGEEAVRARARRVETVPSEKEVEEHNLDHGVFRSWHPHCVLCEETSRGVRTCSKRDRRG